MRATRELQRSFSWRGNDRYTPTALLGHGGNGDVFRALDRHTCDEVAIKVLRKQSAENLRRFHAEFDALASILHRNLVTLYELDARRDPWFIVMEAIDGEPLLPRRRAQPSRSQNKLGDRTIDDPSTLDDGPNNEDSSQGASRPALSLDAIATRFIELCDGVDALHAEGVIHLDLKPANVLFDRNTQRVVIVDLGLAHSNEDSSFALAGTPAYLSPEIIERDRPTTAADRYAIGVMLFEALAGCWPFGGSIAQILASKRARRAPSLREVAPSLELPVALRQLSEALLERAPSARPSLDEVRSTLRSLSLDPSAQRDTASPSFTVRAPAASDDSSDNDTFALLERELVSSPCAEGRDGVVTRKGPTMRATLVIGADRDERRRLCRALTRSVETAVSRDGRPARVLRVRCDAAARVRFATIDRLLRACTRYGADCALAREASRAVDQLIATPGRSPTVVHEAVLSLARLIDELSSQSSLVFVVDEAQDADHESVALLAALALRVKGATRWLLVARDDRDALDVLRAALASAPAIAFDERALKSRPRERLDEAQRSAQEREIIALLRVARGPLSAATLCEACSQRLGFRQAIRALELDGVLACSGPSAGDDGALSLAPSWAERQPTLTTRQHENRLVRALAKTDADRAALARILESRGLRSRARELWEQQASAAQRQLRWDEARRCALSALALATTREDRARLEELCGELYVRCARRSDAGDALARAAELVDLPSKRRSLLLRAAEQWLHSGRYNDGAAALESVSGTRYNAIRSAFSLASNVGRSTGPREDARATLQARLDAGLVFVAGFGLIDPQRVLATHLENRALAASSRCEASKLRLDTAQLLIDGALGAPRDRSASAALVRVEQRASAMIAGSKSVEERAGLDATRFGARGVYAVQRGRFAEGVRWIDKSESAWTAQAADSWDRSVAEHFRLWALYYLGRFSAISLAAPARSWRAHKSDDRFAALDLRTQHSVCAWLLADDAERAEVALDAALAQLAGSVGHHGAGSLVRRDATVARVEIALYRGDGAKAFDEYTSNLGLSPIGDYALPEGLRIDSLVLRARVALAALASGHAALSARAALAGSLIALERETAPWARALALYLRGLNDARARRRSSAIAALSAAERSLNALEMRAFAECAASARRRLTRDVDADRDSLAYFAAEGARDPRAFQRIFLPAWTEGSW